MDSYPTKKVLGFFLVLLSQQDLIKEIKIKRLSFQMKKNHWEQLISS